MVRMSEKGIMRYFSSDRFVLSPVDNGVVVKPTVPPQTGICGAQRRSAEVSSRGH